MCGKFTQMMSWDELVELADFLPRSDEREETVTPMRLANVIRRSPETFAREMVRMRWGMPKHGQSGMKGPGHIHARSESADRTRRFSDAFAHRRGILVVSTFNEGRDLPNGRTEQHVIVPNDSKALAIAVLWERWIEPTGAWFLAFAMLTVPANRLIASITDRMPAILRPEDWEKWLGEEEASVEELNKMLRPCEGDWTMSLAAGLKPAPPKKPDPQPTLF